MIINSFIHEGIELRRCQRAKADQGTAQLYCSQGGATIDEQPEFFSVSRRGVNKVHQDYHPDRPSKKSGGAPNYKFMRHFSNKPCHILIYETWIGDRDPKKVIDHRNGCSTDNRPCNLEEVTRKENDRRRVILNGLRRTGIDPTKIPFKELEHYLDPKNQCNPLAACAEERRKYADD